MEDLLTSVSTTYNTLKSTSDDILIEAEEPVQSVIAPFLKPSTPQEALEALRADPDHESLAITLNYLVHDAPSTSGFYIARPSPLAAQIVNALVSNTIPNYWPVYKETIRKRLNEPNVKNNVGRNLLLPCLRSISGLNAVVARLKSLVQAAKEAGKKVNRSSKVEALEDYLDVLENLLHGEKFLSILWRDLPAETLAKQKALWHEVTSVIGGGKVLNGAAEAMSLINDASDTVKETVWIADGVLYSRWLTRNIINWCLDIQIVPRGTWNPFQEMFAKSLRLGYPDTVLKEILALLNESEEDRKLFKVILDYLPEYEQNMVIEAALKHISKVHLSTNVKSENGQWWTIDRETVSGAAGYLELLVCKDSARRAYLISWLTSLSGAGTGESVGIRRVVIAVLSDSKHDMELILEKSLQQFGDQLYIKHAPSLQQEINTQIVLLSAGYVHRNSPTKLRVILRSSLYLNAVSNRLGASSTRARFLGMVVGEALSGLVEKPDKQMKFKVEELETSEAQWYKSLTNIQDSVGPYNASKNKEPKMPSKKKFKTTTNKLPPVPAIPTVPHGTTKIISIEEVDDEDSEEDLIPYAKPDSDAEDSDEDPTLVQRNKPTAPVYIRDLINFLRDTENYDKQKLALVTASPLIRRKANFGTEVSDHVEELATLLVGLQDKYEIDEFQDLRIQGMIAVLLSQPAKMGRWFSNTFFEGDYSIAQRASILTVLSISARELGGFKEDDKSLTKMKAIPENSFPSKRLPDRLHKIYASEQQRLSSPVDALSQQLSNAMIQPLAASLADKATGPDVLKVRTFSSRLAVESRRKAPTTNALSAIVANSFFFPLTGRFFAHLKAYGSDNVIFEPYLLSSFLKTLSLILHASGPLTLQLPQMTSEMWDLLLSLRMQGHGDGSVGEALLFAFMTLLEINEDKRRLAETHGRELLETQGWIELLFQKLGSGTEEDDKVRALAAGVLFKIREVVEKYQALLMGDISSF